MRFGDFIENIEYLILVDGRWWRSLCNTHKNKRLLRPNGRTLNALTTSFKNEVDNDIKRTAFGIHIFFIRSLVNVSIHFYYGLYLCFWIVTIILSRSLDDFIQAIKYFFIDMLIWIKMLSNVLSWLKKLYI